MPSQKTQEQKRAKSAWEAIANSQDPKGIKYDTGAAKKYKSFVKSAPSMILTNGLGQTLAFWRSKSPKNDPEDRAYKALLNHLSQWITVRIPKTNNNLLGAVVSTYDSDDYRRATNETLAYLVWLKRFAEAEIME